MMKRLPVALLGLFFIFFAACKNGDNKDNQNNGVSGGNGGPGSRSVADSMYNELLKEHNAGMAGWMRIEEKQKQIRAMLDSIGTLPSKGQSALAAYKTSLEKATTDLGTAYEEMDTWMKEMNLDSAENNTELRIQYLTGEKQRGVRITELINNSLQKADSLLKAKP